MQATNPHLKGIGHYAEYTPHGAPGGIKLRKTCGLVQKWPQNGENGGVGCDRTSLVPLPKWVCSSPAASTCLTVPADSRAPSTPSDWHASTSIQNARAYHPAQHTAWARDDGERESKMLFFPPRQLPSGNSNILSPLGYVVSFCPVAGLNCALSTIARTNQHAIDANTNANKGPRDSGGPSQEPDGRKSAK